MIKKNILIEWDLDGMSFEEPKLLVVKYLDWKGFGWKEFSIEGDLEEWGLDKSFG